MKAIIQLYADARAYGLYVMFQHGTIVRVGDDTFEITNELAEYVDVDACAFTDVDMNIVNAQSWLDVVRMCYAGAYAGAYAKLYYGTCDPVAQCEIDGNKIHIACGDVDVYVDCSEDTYINPYAIVELDKLFPHICAVFDVIAEKPVVTAEKLDVATEKHNM